MSNITLSLGGFIFQGMEIPEVIPFHAAQALAVKTMVGGVRQIDAMGVDHKPVSWTGTIFPVWMAGAAVSALERAKQLELLRDAGQPLVLSWDSLRYRVLISDFSPDYRTIRIPYSITLEVLEDLTKPATEVINPDIDQIAATSLAQVNTLRAQYQLAPAITHPIGDALTAITDALGLLASALYTASSWINAGASASATLTPSQAASAGTTVAAGTASLVGAPPSKVNPVIQATVAAINVVESARVMVDANVAASPMNGALQPGFADDVSTLMAAIDLQCTLLQLGWTLSVLLKNLQTIDASAKTITVSGGSLYQVAAQQYGDATAADLIMAANGLTDPIITGTVVLVIPSFSKAAANGGIWAH